MEVIKAITLEYPMEIKPDGEGGWLATYPDLPGVVANTKDRAGIIEAAEELRVAYIKSLLEDGDPIPTPGELAQAGGQIALRLPRSLHRKLKWEAKREGVSLNQYTLYLLSKQIGSQQSNHS